MRNESQARESAEESERMGLIGGVGMAGIAGWGIASYRSRKRRHGSVFGEAKIKGNISRDGRKIYHEPGGQYYNSVVVNPKEGEKYFKTKDDAEKAGFVSVG